MTDSERSAIAAGAAPGALPPSPPPDAPRPHGSGDRLGRRTGHPEDWRRSAPTRPEAVRRPPPPRTPEEAVARLERVLANQRVYRVSRSRARVVGTILERLGTLAKGLRIRPWLRQPWLPYLHRQSRERAVRMLLGAGGYRLLVVGLRRRATAKETHADTAERKQQQAGL